jgi:hypothetical protein
MATDNNQKSYIKILIRIRPVLRWLFRLRGSSKAVAGGLALGVFIAITPTIGLQVVLAALLATIFNLNRPAAIITVWITNPFTIPVIFTFNYWVGTMFFSGPPVSDVAKRLFDFVKQMASFDLWQMIDQFTAFMQLGQEVLIPLATGSIMVSSCMAAVIYVVSKRILDAYFARRERKRKIRRTSHHITEKNTSHS